MAIVRCNPWTEINSFRRQLNHIFDEDAMFEVASNISAVHDTLTPATFAEFANFYKPPAAELIETEEALVLRLEVPGMQPGDIDIEATAKSISIKGDRKSEVQAELADKTRSEFGYGSFERVISLPVRIQNTEVKAEYKDGILHLTLPKAEEEKNKVVKVNLLD